MPYSVRKQGSSYQLVNTSSGKVHSRHTSKARAERQRRLLEGVHRGWKPTGRRAKR